MIELRVAERDAPRIGPTWLQLRLRMRRMIGGENIDPPFAHARENAVLVLTSDAIRGALRSESVHLLDGVEDVLRVDLHSDGDAIVLGALDELHARFRPKVEN